MSDARSQNTYRALESASVVRVPSPHVDRWLASRRHMDPPAGPPAIRCAWCLSVVTIGDDTCPRCVRGVWRESGCRFCGRPHTGHPAQACAACVAGARVPKATTSIMESDAAERVRARLASTRDRGAELLAQVRRAR